MATTPGGGLNALVLVPHETRSITCPFVFFMTTASPAVSKLVPIEAPRVTVGVLEGICQNDFVLALGLIKIKAFEAMVVPRGSVRNAVLEALVIVHPDTSTEFLVPLYNSTH